jgi:hypothetical protein
MLYAILCYDSDKVVGAWSPEQDAAVMTSLGIVQEKLERQGKLGPVARLMPVASAKTVRKGHEMMVLDGPFAETKEQLLGFFVVDCATLEEALDAARELGQASGSAGAYEVRPMMLYRPGSLPNASLG